MSGAIRSPRTSRPASSPAIAGILLAGYVGTPGLLAGDTYLLPTIAAVVLGGTSLAGGNGSVVATAVGALFLIQLKPSSAGMGAPASVQLIIQGSIIALGMAVSAVIDRRRAHSDRPTRHAARRWSPDR